MAIANGSVTCGTSPTKVCTLGEGGALITGSVSGCFAGGPNVATSGTSIGIPVPVAPTTLFVPGARTIPSTAVPSGADQTCDLYVISAAGSQSVTYLAPQGG